MTRKRTAEQERLRQARRRRRKAEREWEQATNYWVAKIVVIHSICLREFLIKVHLLEAKDVLNQAAIEYAVEELLGGGSFVMTGYEWSTEIHGHSAGSPLSSRWRRADTEGELNIRMTPEIAERMARFLAMRDRSWGEPDPELVDRYIDDRGALNKAVEEWLYLQYSGFVPDPVLDSYGIPWGTWNYQRGGDRAPPKRKPKPDPAWTTNEQRDLEGKFRKRSGHHCGLSRQEAKERRKQERKNLKAETDRNALLGRNGGRWGVGSD